MKTAAAERGVFPDSSRMKNSVNFANPMVGRDMLQDEQIGNDISTFLCLIAMDCKPKALPAKMPLYRMGRLRWLQTSMERWSPAKRIQAGHERIEYDGILAFATAVAA